MGRDTQPTWNYWISIMRRTYNPYVQKSKSQSYLMQLVPTLAGKPGKAKIGINRDIHTIPTKINGRSKASIRITRKSHRLHESRLEKSHPSFRNRVTRARPLREWGS